MSWLGNSVNFVLKKLVSLEVPPNKVVEVKTQEFSSRFVRKREESLVLYGPTEARNADTKYEIVLNVPFRDEAFRFVTKFVYTLKYLLGPILYFIPH